MVDKLGTAGLDPAVQQIVVDAQNRAQRVSDRLDGPEEAARRAAEIKLQIKAAEQKKGDVKETFTRDEGVARRWQQASEGKFGPEVAAGAAAWQNSEALQQKLTHAQKQMFQRAFTDSPSRGAQAGEAMARLAAMPSFAAAVPSTPLLGMVQSEVAHNPKLEQPIAALLQNQFLAPGGGNKATQGDFLRFGLSQVRAGQADALGPPGDMLRTLVRTQTPGAAQQAALNMVKRDPKNTLGMQNVDMFVQAPAVRSLPQFARGKATEVLAGADGRAQVRDGLLDLAKDEKFLRQSEQNKGRFFATIGTGRPTELRALTDLSLVALRSEKFPQRDAQVQRLLTKMGAQAQRSGAASIDLDSLLTSASAPNLPKVPTFVSAQGLSPEDAKAVAAQNRIALIQFYNRYRQAYDKVDSKLQAAKYLQDVNNLNDLRAPQALDTSNLTAEDRLFAEQKAAGTTERFANLQRQQRQKMRELGTTVISKRQRATKARARRAIGEQARYFNPRTGQAIAGRASTTFGAAAAEVQGRQGQAETIQQAAAAVAGGGTAPQTDAAPGAAMTQGSVAAQLGPQMPHSPPAARRRVTRNQPQPVGQTDLDGLLASLPEGLSSEQKFAQAKKLLERRWKADLQHVVSALIQAPAAEAGEPNAAAAQLPEGTQSATSQATRGNVARAGQDGWGIPRVFDQDLGGRVPQRPVKAPLGPRADPQSAEPTSKATAPLGPPIVHPMAQPRPLSVLQTVAWKQATSAERAVLQTLGWSQQTWDTRQTPTARWPQSMRTSYAALSIRQRDAVRKLGLNEAGWDRQVSAVLMQAEQ